MHHFRRFGFVSGCPDHDWRGRCVGWIGPFVRFEYYERSGECLLSHIFWLLTFPISFSRTGL
jgi:hypothetical protein